MGRKPLRCEDVLAELDWTRCEACTKRREKISQVTLYSSDWPYLEYRALLRQARAAFPCTRDQALLWSLRQRRRGRARHSFLDWLFFSWGGWLLLLWVAAALNWAFSLL